MTISSTTLRLLPLLLLPFLAILGARLMAHSDWAAANATLAALLFAWIVADALGLAALAKAPRDRSGLRALLGAVALAGVVVMVGASAPLRAALVEMPILLAVFVAAAAGWSVWSLSIFIEARRGGATVETATATILPPTLVHFFVRELRFMHLALFRWRLEPDVPQGSSSHRYDRILAPLLWVLLALQVIELGVVHLLLALWNPLVAWVTTGLTLAGILWFIAIIKSIRLYPVLLDRAGVHVRGGIVVEAFVPYEAIAATDERLDADTRRARATLDLAILSEPNIVLRLSTPVTTRNIFGKSRPVDRIALKLDDPQAFLRELAARR